METTILILFVLALTFFVMECFIPSAGLLGLLSFGCLVAAVWMLFEINTTAGWISLIASAVTIPVLLAIMLKAFPHTFIGKKLIMANPQTATGSQLTYDPARDANPQSLIGAQGLAITALRPVGICRIGDHRAECLSVAGTIEPGTPVRVESVSGIEVKVRVVS